MTTDQFYFWMVGFLSNRVALDIVLVEQIKEEMKKVKLDGVNSDNVDLLATSTSVFGNLRLTRPELFNTDGSPKVY